MFSSGKNRLFLYNSYSVTHPSKSVFTAVHLTVCWLESWCLMKIKGWTGEWETVGPECQVIPWTPQWPLFSHFFFIATFSISFGLSVVGPYVLAVWRVLADPCAGDNNTKGLCLHVVFVLGHKAGPRPAPSTPTQKSFIGGAVREGVLIWSGQLIYSMTVQCELSSWWNYIMCFWIRLWCST